MTLRVQTSELLSGLVQLNLGGLGLGDLLLELLGLAGDLDGELLDVECELLDLGLVRAPVLLKSQVVLLLLPCSQSPLLQLLLIPVHL